MKNQDIQVGQFFMLADRGMNRVVYVPNSARPAGVSSLRNVHTEDESKAKQWHLWNVIAMSPSAMPPPSFAFASARLHYTQGNQVAAHWQSKPVYSPSLLGVRNRDLIQPLGSGDNLREFLASRIERFNVDKLEAGEREKQLLKRKANDQTARASLPAKLVHAVEFEDWAVISELWEQR